MATKTYRSKKSTPVSKSDIKITFTDDSDAQGKPRVLVCGRSGSGRTTFASTFPKPLFINIDKGLRTVKDKHLMKIDISPGGHTHDEIIEILAALRKGEAPFDKQTNVPQTLVIDDLSGLSELFEREVINYAPPTSRGETRDDGLFLQDYNVIQNRMVTFLTLLKDLPIYVVVISSIYFEKDPNLEGVFEVPHVTGNKLPPRVPTYFDEVFYTEKDTKEDKYILRTVPTKRFPYGKTKSGIKESEIVNPSYTKLKKYFE